MLTVGSVLTTNVSQISLCQLLFRATLKVRLDSCLSLLLEWTTLTAPKWMHISKNSQLLYGRGSFTSASKHYFKVPTTTWGVPPGHILTNLIINWLLDANADRKWGKSPILRAVNGWRLPKLAKRLTRQRSLSAWIPGLSTLKVTGFSATLLKQTSSTEKSVLSSMHFPARGGVSAQLST